MSRSFDVVLFGATGIAGREAARHLGRRAPQLGLRWAAAGRDRERVAETLRSVGVEADGLLEADTSRPATIADLAAAARILVNLVGPYSQHGEVVYEACIEQGICQLDLTGELDWLVDMVSRHHAAASETGARIVPVCGFESLPFDLGTRFVAEAARDRHGESVVAVDVAVTNTGRAAIRRPADVVSGGTWASVVGMVRRGGLPSGSDSRTLDPPGTGGDPRPFRVRPRRHAGTGAWIAPMVPVPVLNPPVVYRSAALFRADGDAVFDPSFEYLEGTAVPAALVPLLSSSMAGARLGLAGLRRGPAPLRRGTAAVLGRIGPKPGRGPREQDLDRWRYRLDIRATTTSGATADGEVEAVGHPGYKSASTMVAEAALILADPSSDVPARAGVLTPATALGTAHLDRFAEAGTSFRLR